MGRVVGVELDDDAIRRRCLAEGWEASRDADAEPAKVRTCYGGRLYRDQRDRLLKMMLPLVKLAG